MNWPGGYVVRLDGDNIDGDNNSRVVNGSDGYSWANTGSFATPFVRSTVPGTPLIKKLPGLSSVAFDGRSDILTCAGSAAALAFIHTAAATAPGPVWDMALVLRRMGTQDLGVRVLGTEGKGLGLYSTINSPLVSPPTIEGGFQFFLSNGSGEMSTLVTQQARAPLGEVCGLFVRADGNKLSVTQNFWDWEEQAFLAGAGVGPASDDYGLGSTGGNNGLSGNFFCFEVFDLLIWSRNLDDVEEDVVLANFEARAAA